MRTELEPITGDNRRPGMNPDHKFLVRYDSHPRFGWLCAATFLTEEEALDFQQSKKDDAEIRADIFCTVPHGSGGGRIC